MPITTQTVYQCDICGNKSDPLPPGAKPQAVGAIVYDREHPMEERSWIKTVICRGCQKAIHQAQKNAFSAGELDLLLNKP